MKEIKNKKAYFTYEILEKFEAGISLIGQEVKSIKSGTMNLSSAYVVIRNEEVFLIGAHIPPYQFKNAPSNYKPERPRKLLLKKAEIRRLIGKTKQKGLTMVPLRVYSVKGKIKVEFALAKGRGKPDKRRVIKKRETAREIQREQRRFNE